MLVSAAGCRASSARSNKGSLRARARAHEWWMAVADQPTRGDPPTPSFYPYRRSYSLFLKR